MPVDLIPFVERIKGKPLDQILSDYEAERWDVNEIARDLAVSKFTVYRWLKQTGRETVTSIRRCRDDESPDSG